MAPPAYLSSSWPVAPTVHPSPSQIPGNQLFAKRKPYPDTDLSSSYKHPTPPPVPSLP